MDLADILKQDILAGHFGPGTVLLQTELAARYGVSRIPVRDALQRLAAEKLVEVVPGKGARIPVLTPDDLNEIFDLRVMIECDLLSRATAVATIADHDEVNYALRKSSLEAGRPGWHIADWEFHRALYHPAQRLRQLNLAEELRASCVLFANGYGALAASTSQWMADHSAIAEAYCARDADKACAILTEHIQAAHARLHVALMA